MKRLLFFSLLMGCITTRISSFQTTFSITPKTAHVGDRLEMHAVIFASLETDTVLIVFDKADVEVVSVNNLPERKVQGGKIFEKIFTVAVFRTGNVRIGPFEVKFFRNREETGIERFPSVAVTIQSVLTDEDTDISGLKPVKPLPGNPMYVLPLWLFLLGTAGSAGWIAFRRHRRKKNVPAPQPILSPEDALSRKLRELLAEEWHIRGEFKRFFIRLTQDIKTFIERYYRFPAPECTSSETLWILNREETDKTLVEDIRIILTLADEVKFSRMKPTPQRINEVVKKLVRVAERYQRRKPAAQ